MNELIIFTLLKTQVFWGFTFEFGYRRCNDIARDACK